MKTIEELEAQLETVTRERDEARRLLELAHLGRAQLEGWRDGLERERDEARAEVERLRKGLEPIADGTIWNAKESAEFLLRRKP